DWMEHSFPLGSVNDRLFLFPGCSRAGSRPVAERMAKREYAWVAARLRMAGRIVSGHNACERQDIRQGANMVLRNLGRSGLRVSLVGLGCNNFGQRMDLESS